jgi:uncharacterized protein (DUF362 family)
MIERVMILGRKRISRRKFIEILGGLAVATGVSGVLWEIWRPKEQPKPPRPARPNAYTQDGKSLISIVRGASDTDIESIVRNSLDAIGGLGKIISTGMVVVVKPAVLTSDPDCAPDPRVVAALVKLAKDAGGEVIVAESSGQGSTAYNLSRIGITSAVEEVGAEARDLETEKEVLLNVPKGVSLDTVWVYPTICDCDVLISVPRLKRHGSTTVTMSLKNMMGTIPKSEMGRFHQIDLSQCIADLNTVIKPDLTVVDAIFAMAGTGPTGGEMIEMNTIMASGDPVAVDRIAAEKLHELEQRMGISSFNAAGVRHINAAADLEVGTTDPDHMKIIEKSLA